MQIKLNIYQPIMVPLLYSNAYDWFENLFFLFKTRIKLWNVCPNNDTKNTLLILVIKF